MKKTLITDAMLAASPQMQAQAKAQYQCRLGEVPAFLQKQEREPGAYKAVDPGVLVDTGAAKRDNSGKPEMDHVLNWPKAIEAVARVSEMGARKYGSSNFKKGGKPNHEYYGCAMRHLFKAYNGEDFDTESGGMHIAHAIWNLMTLIEMNWEGDVYDPTQDVTQTNTKRTSE